jgi:hypothetical protein
VLKSLAEGAAVALFPDGLGVAAAGAVEASDPADALQPARLSSSGRISARNTIAGRKPHSLT